MTIYEFLGFGSTLDIEIPKEKIIENLSWPFTANTANRYFSQIDSVILRASLNRQEHYLQVLEVNLNDASNIDDISVMIQKAIKYRILFVFVYQERYLLVCRNFDLTESTENVYTSKVTCGTDWIYQENLNDDMFCSCNIQDINMSYVDNEDEEYEIRSIKAKRYKDNGDLVYFEDVLSNIRELNESMAESGVVCVRYLYDWFQTHNAGNYTDIKEVLKEVCRRENHCYLGNHLFLDKNDIICTISELNHFKYDVSLDHTGSNPISYFKEIESVSTYSDEYAVIAFINEQCHGISYDENDEVEITDSTYQLSDTEGYGHNYIGNDFHGATSIQTSYFLNEIFRRFEWRGYHLLEESPLKVETIIRLRRRGFQVLEQFRTKSLEDLQDIPSQMIIDLVLCMDKYHMRLKDCSKESYPKVTTYLMQRVKCRSCKGYIFSDNWVGLDGYCPECKSRLERVSANKGLDISEINLKVRQSTLFEDYHDVEMVINVDCYPAFKDDVKIEVATFSTSCGKIFDFSFNVVNPCDEEDIGDYEDTDYDIAFKLSAWKSFYGDISQIKLRLWNLKSGYHFTYVYSVRKEARWYGSVYCTELYDYDEELIMTERQKCEMQKLIREHLAKANGIMLPPFVCNCNEECIGSCEDLETAIHYLEAELDKKASSGHRINLNGFAEIPYEKVIEVRDPLPHSENIEPPNFFELLVKDIDYSEMWIEELDLSYDL